MKPVSPLAKTLPAFSTDLIWAFNAALRALLLLGLAVGQVGVSLAYGQAQVTPVGILSFRPESGISAPVDLGQKIAQELQRSLNATYNSLLARALSPVHELTIEQLAAFGKQNGVKFLVRGGLLPGRADVIQLYAEIVSVETATVVTLRTEGTASQTDMSSGDFSAALSNQIEQLAAGIHKTLAPLATEEASLFTDAKASPDSYQGNDVSKDKPAREADEELQQLIAQAESILGVPTAINTETLESIRQAFEALKAALEKKATLMEQGKDPAEADQAIAGCKQELQSAMATATEQAASEQAAIAQSQEPSGEKKNILASIGEYLGEATNILQKIQEIRALWRGAREDQSHDTEAPAASEETPPIEEPIEEVSGVVTEASEPVEGVTVTEPESGATATTDRNGSYVLRIVPGKLNKLVLRKMGKQVATGQVELQRGRPAIADFELQPHLAGASQPGPKVMPSTVLVKRDRQGGTTGRLSGVVRDAQGRPVARALVSLRGVAVARTDSQGRYAFIGVPADTHQLTFHKSGLKLQSEQVQIRARSSSQSSIKLVSSDRNIEQQNRHPIGLRGAGTVLRGVVTDNKKQKLAGAKITLMLPTGAVSVRAGSNGAYVLRDIKAGEYRVVVTKFGYGPYAESLVLLSGTAETRDFKLKKSTSPLLATLQNAKGTQAGTDNRPVRRIDPPNRHKNRHKRTTGRTPDRY